MSESNLLKMDRISKEFPGVKALNNVCMELRKGEIHALCGENGAGKSTLIKILAGIVKPSAGEIYINGYKQEISSPLVATKLGIAVIHQELSLSPTISVAENLFLGREYNRKSGLLNKSKMASEAAKWLNLLHCDISPGMLLKNLNVAQQQLVQISKALSQDARIIVMDEPFSALGDKDTKNLFGIMNSLREKGVSVIYIDHRIDNFFIIADRITILRDGEHIKTSDIDEINKEEIISLMVGRSIKNIYPAKKPFKKDVILEVDNLSSKKVNNITFQVRKGEIVGLGGLVGAGRTEVARAIIGRDHKSSGTISIQQKVVKIHNPSDAIRNGIAYIPEDRKLSALVLKRSVKFNCSLAYIDYYKTGIFINNKKETKGVSNFVDRLNIKTSGLNVKVNNLSGGNQQKVVLAKYLMLNNLKVLILDEPTRGIDVGAKHEIYNLINSLAETGMAIILITSELPELIGLCHRVVTIKNGIISGALSENEMTAEKILSCCI